MTLTAQVYAGTVDDANSYGVVADMRAYFLERGVDLSSSTDDQLSSALIRATDFLDTRYSFVGDQLRAVQGTACPRFLPGTVSRGTIRDVNFLAPAYLLTLRQWQVLVTSCYKLAQRALSSADLLPDPTQDPSGLEVIEKKTVAGPVETSKKFQPSTSGRSDNAAPLYPDVDLALKNARLLQSNSFGTLARG